eukprot:NODE_406_length_9252_cov_0.363269.p4 type:complete len:329 gc:universal NODE_406_length_9252_cov_0.363269:6940-5954(-)
MLAIKLEILKIHQDYKLDVRVTKGVEDGRVVGIATSMRRLKGKLRMRLEIEFDDQELTSSEESMPKYLHNDSVTKSELVSYTIPPEQWASAASSSGANWRDSGPFPFAAPTPERVRKLTPLPTVSKCKKRSASENRALGSQLMAEVKNGSASEKLENGTPPAHSFESSSVTKRPRTISKVRPLAYLQKTGSSKTDTGAENGEVAPVIEDPSSACVPNVVPQLGLEAQSSSAHRAMPKGKDPDISESIHRLSRAFMKVFKGRNKHRELYQFFRVEQDLTMEQFYIALASCDQEFAFHNETSNKKWPITKSEYDANRDVLVRHHTKRMHK